MDKDLLSIIVPVYNVENYLERSLQSVLNQTYQNLEVILVDDGSTDGSSAICKRYASLDARITLISQKNLGASAARRNGIRQAAGGYVGFVDPDDYVDADFYQQMMECRADFDVVVSQWYRESGKQTRHAYDTIQVGEYRTPQDIEFLIQHLINVSLPGGLVNIRPGIASYLWNKIFKAEIVKSVVEKIRIDLPISNDRPLVYSTLLECKSVLITDICGYHYCVRNDSTAHSIDKQCHYLKTICNFYNLMDEIFSLDPRYKTLLPQLQVKMSELITRAPQKMGFCKDAYLHLNVPVFPFLNLLDGKQVVLYGANTIGQTYQRQIVQWNTCKLLLWIDEEWKSYSRVGMRVFPLETVLKEIYDFVVLAVETERSAKSARQKLEKLGVDSDKILWKKPLNL